MIPIGADERIFAVDLARGTALLGMVAYHFVWDLHAFGLSTTDPGLSLAWHGLGQSVATVFLFLSGLSLVLARRRGGTLLAALRRIAMIAIAGEAVTAVTAVMAPEETVLFGMLQCIALSNLLALPLLPAPAVGSLGLALIAFAVPVVAPANVAPSLWWVGLSNHVPDTLDVRPLLPWAGVVLLGVAFGQVANSAWPPWAGAPLSALHPNGGRIVDRRSDRRPDGGASNLNLRAVWRRAAGLLAGAGRHSLSIYLVHQPALFGGFLMLAAASMGSKPGFDDRSSSFVSSCTERCVARDTDPERCMALCRCVQKRLNADPTSAHLPEILTLYATACITESTAPMTRR